MVCALNRGLAWVAIRGSCVCVGSAGVVWCAGGQQEAHAFVSSAGKVVMWHC